MHTFVDLGKILFDGDLDIYVRTASKYDDCRMLHLPSIRLTFKLNWVCLADEDDHHSVQPCAPNKLPEYSSNQEHDSYRAFRSQHLNMNISLETRSGRRPTCPMAVLYGSTLRFLLLEVSKNNFSLVILVKLKVIKCIYSDGSRI